jgi:AraC family transcriptional regulator
MLQSGIRLLDAASGDVMPSAPQGSVLASSEAAWRGVVVEYQRLTPMEMPAHLVVGHRMVVHLGQDLQFEWHNQARWNRAWYPTGSFALQSDGDFHAPRWHQPFECIAIAWEPQFVSGLVGDHPIEFEEIRGRNDPVVTQLALRMKHLLAISNDAGPLFKEALTTAFTSHLLQEYSVQKSHLRLLRGRLEGRSLKNVVEFAHDHISQPLTLETLAAQAHLSPFHFARQFKATLGLSPHQFLLKIRIEKAIQLLSTRQSLTEIAFATGFHDQSHFIHAFKRMTGHTPKAFLK